MTMELQTPQNGTERTAIHLTRTVIFVDLVQLALILECQGN